MIHMHTLCCVDSRSVSKSKFHVCGGVVRVHDICIFLFTRCGWLRTALAGKGSLEAETLAHNLYCSER